MIRKNGVYISMKQILKVIFFVLLSSSAMAQSTYVPLGNPTYEYIDRFDIKYGKLLPAPFTSSRPFSRAQVAAFVETLSSSNIKLSKSDARNLKYMVDDNSEWYDSLKSTSRKPFLRYFYKEPATFYGVRTKNDEFILKINPILNVGLGAEVDDRLILNNGRGLEFRASIMKKISVSFSLVSNQQLWPTYVDDRILRNNFQAIPGLGYFKYDNTSPSRIFKQVSYDYYDYRGSINFSILKHIDVQFGHDKNFIGNGYRSLFLSDNSAPYLFLKLNTRIWRINYQNIFAEMQGQYKRGGDRLLDKKFAAFHHLSVNVAKWLDIGFFEGVIMNRKKQFDIQYLNPIIFYRSIEQSIGSPDNSLIGADIKVNFARHGQIYGQFLLDEFNFSQFKKKWWGNKYGFQLGAKYIDVGGLKNLDLQMEFNMVRPYTYTHLSNSTVVMANYTHYNQALAHPLGANFRELIAIVKYQPIKNLELKLKYIYANTGADSSGSNWGSNIFLPASEKYVETTFGNLTTQGVKQNITIIHLIASYQLRHNLFFDFQYSVRNLKSDIKENSKSISYVLCGLRINIPHRTFDF